MSDSHREFHAKAAKKLLKLVRAGDPSALARVRAVLHGKRDLPDAELVKEVGLQNCQHVVAKEAGFTNWSALLEEPVQPTKPAVPSLKRQPREPSESDFSDLLLHFASRFLRTEHRHHIDRAHRNLAKHFAARGVHVPWNEYDNPTKDPQRAAFLDANALIHSRTTPIFIVNGEQRPKAPKLQKENLAPEDLPAYSRAIGEAAAFIEAEEFGVLESTATTWELVRRTTRDLPWVVGRGTEITFNGAPWLKEEVPEGGDVANAWSVRIRWEIKLDMWMTDVLLKVSERHAKRLGDNEAISAWLNEKVGCDSVVRYSWRGFVYVRFMAPADIMDPVRHPLPPPLDSIS